jgi:hypothetical protein
LCELALSEDKERGVRKGNLHGERHATIEAIRRNMTD